jgi:hypothetical protein
VFTKIGGRGARPTRAHCSTGLAVLLKSKDGAWGLALVTNISQFEIQKEIPVMFFTFVHLKKLRSNKILIFFPRSTEAHQNTLRTGDSFVKLV